MAGFGLDRFHLRKLLKHFFNLGFENAGSADHRRQQIFNVVIDIAEQPHHFAAQILSFKSLGDDRPKILGFDGLGNKIDRTLFHGFDGTRDCPVRRHDDDGYIGRYLMDPLEDIQTAYSRQFNIQQQQAGRILRRRIESRLPIRRRDDVMSHRFQPVAEDHRDVRIVFHQQDESFHQTPSSGRAEAPVHGVFQQCGTERFEKKCARSIAQCLGSGVLQLGSGNHDHGHCGIGCFDLMENFDAVHMRHPDVQEHAVVGAPLECIKSLKTVNCGLDAIAV